MEKTKLLGTLYGAAYGDSLGAVTEFCTRERIAAAFHGGYRGYTEETESISHITQGIRAGSVTDDFGSSIYFMRAILEHGGAMSREIAVEAVLRWADDPVVFGKYAGANSKAAIGRLRQGIVVDEALRRRSFTGANTNGGAMRVSPMGLLAGGSLDRAVRYAEELCWPTHYNSEAVAGAAAIACAVTAAQTEGATLTEIAQAAVYGARKARRELELEGFGAWGPHVDRRIEYAIRRGSEISGTEACIELLNGEIGTGIAVQESVPAVFAAILANDGDLRRTLYCTSNAGGDTDTISSMAGAILGGWLSVEAVGAENVARLNEANRFLQLEETVEEFADLCMRATES